MFNITSGNWDTLQTIGNPPVPATGYCCSAVKEKIYYFGGRFISGIKKHHNCINELDTTHLKWTQIKPNGREDSHVAVMPRGYGKMIALEINGIPHLLMVGGVGDQSGTAPGASYVEVNAEPKRIRTNEQNAYDLSQGKP